MDNDRIVEIGARALAEESTGVLWDQMTSGQKAAEIARSKRECRAVLAAFEEAGLVVEQGWQPISTAPRDGSQFLAWFPDRDDPFQCAMWLFADDTGEGPDLVGAVWAGDGRESAQPTHWRPLPAPPAAKADPQ